MAETESERVDGDNLVPRYCSELERNTSMKRPVDIRTPDEQVITLLSRSGQGSHEW